MNKLQELIAATNIYYDLEDTAAWIMENKEAVLQILLEESGSDARVQSRISVDE